MNKREKENLIREFVGPAIYEGISHWHGRKGHQRAVFNVERYIWREEDYPSLRVAIGEQLVGPNIQVNVWGTQDIQTRFLEYVPTGKIRFVHGSSGPIPFLFEYRLKESRELRKA